MITSINEFKEYLNEGYNKTFNSVDDVISYKESEIARLKRAMSNGLEHDQYLSVVKDMRKLEEEVGILKMQLNNTTPSGLSSELYYAIEDYYVQKDGNSDFLTPESEFEIIRDDIKIQTNNIVDEFKMIDVNKVKFIKRTEIK